jgi:hypothetical protein
VRSFPEDAAPAGLEILLVLFSTKLLPRAAGLNMKETRFGQAPHTQ